MDLYARIDDGFVAEVFSTDSDINELFHPDLVWVKAPVDLPVTTGWSYSNGVFSEPPPEITDDIQIRSEVMGLMERSDMVAIRCMKAGVPYPAEWLAFVSVLRDILRSQDFTSPLPQIPPFPSGT